jgi:hypothetical protein
MDYRSTNYETVTVDGIIEEYPAHVKTNQARIDDGTMDIPEFNKYLFSLIDMTNHGEDPLFCLAEGLQFIEMTGKTFEASECDKLEANKAIERFLNSFHGLLGPVREGLDQMSRVSSEPKIHSLFKNADDFKRFKSVIDEFNRETLKYLIGEVIRTGDDTYNDLIFYINRHGSSLYRCEVKDLDEKAQLGKGGALYTQRIREGLKIKKMDPFEKRTLDKSSEGSKVCIKRVIPKKK